MSSAEIRLLIVDLDNTLYDWVSFFVPAFYSMVDTAARLLEIDRETLLSDLQKVHQRYGTSEQPFALVEAAAVVAALKEKSAAQRVEALDIAFHAFNSKRKALLTLYPGVRETLQTVAASGAKIVAHTEASMPNPLFRVERLGLLDIIDRLYAPESRGSAHPEYEPQPSSAPQEFVRLLPSDHKKPNPTVIADILADYAAEPNAVLYVGDSISKDVAMAANAGIHSAWAKYGTNFDRELWDQLVRVTHWTAEDVQREAAVRDQARDVKAETEINSFDELLQHYRFVRLGSNPSS